ncbi:conserved hypothetical protein containing farnes oic acid O-methyl transferase domain [Formosa agariphila KMM 3901]|uniref:DUF6250 domain-containing protein n=1 Tax=Formosa agariphila (strain DSM 15362 / KCTC 12365 / LMG 23005 / KMM 3901 / M-2Alg 35-1) TaxID=1347342 RepID=T2KK09_FORAG|nr:DUF6250 domain-containing protein [Formosa agariphila]CDF78756.1 conserved hypothetical protein containing farnes oic acid O-methyl transferase domain [Formosa agariphila KMM 3901]
MFRITRKTSIGVLLLAIGFLFTSCEEKMETVKIHNEELQKELIFEDNFDSGLEQWNVEQGSEGRTVETNKSKLEIDDVAGCTVWLKEAFSGSIMIEYDVNLIKDGGPNDRVSDLNCFWMATDPENPSNLFANSKQRDGKFSNYDSLQLYYMGVGGNDNKTTRFRRYTGDGGRPLLPEHDLSDTKFMLEPNTPYHIKIIAHNGIIQYYRNDQLLVDFKDDAPYTSGHFGFRTVKNHMTVDNFKVYQLK